MSFGDRIKQKVWHLIYKFFPALQKVLLKLGIIWHQKERQEYPLGWLAPGKTLEALKIHLYQAWGFGNHFIAWIDSGQVLSWRKLTDFKNQYHLRVFEDGEIRGHYELTPEAHPIDHFREKGTEARKEDFLKFLGEFVVAKKFVTHLSMDPNAWDPESQIHINSQKKEFIS